MFQLPLIDVRFQKLNFPGVVLSLLLLFPPAVVFYLAAAVPPPLTGDFDGFLGPEASFFNELIFFSAYPMCVNFLGLFMDSKGKLGTEFGGGGWRAFIARKLSPPPGYKNLAKLSSS